MKKWGFVIGHVILFSFFVFTTGEGVNSVMKLESPNFENQGDIPKKFTCDGTDISTALA